MAYIAKINAGGTDHLIGSSLYGYCETAAATVAKVVSIAGFDTLISGVTIHVMFKYTNTATSPTLNVSSTGAKPIYAYGTTATGKAVGSNWCANAVVALTYDTNITSTGAWMVNDYIANTDTNTKVTSAANHYAPSADSSSALNAPSSATTGLTFLDKVTLSRDAKGHVTAASASSHSITVTTGSVGSASAGTAIAADDITAWTTNTKPSLTYTAKSVGSASGWSAGTAASASVASGVLTITNGTAPSLTISSVDCDDITAWDAGTQASLSYTARSIPNISVTSTTVVIAVS